MVTVTDLPQALQRKIGRRRRRVRNQNPPGTQGNGAAWTRVEDKLINVLKEGIYEEIRGSMSYKQMALVNISITLQLVEEPAGTYYA